MPTCSAMAPGCTDMSEPTVPGELSAIHDRLNAGDKRMEAIESQLVENTRLTIENTEITKDIKEVLDAARLGFKVIGGLGSLAKWTGSIAAALAAIWGFVYLLTHGGVPPK